MKAHILIPYYMRSQYLLNAVSSIAQQDISPELLRVTIIDDSPTDHPDTVTAAQWRKDYDFRNDVRLLDPRIITVNETLKDKEAQGLTRMGAAMNNELRETDADLALVLCDDDCLYPRALENVIQFFAANPNEVWGYGMAMRFNPNYVYPYVKELGFFYPADVTHPYTADTPAKNKLDISQVVWRPEAMREADAWFPRRTHPRKRPLDFYFYERMDKAYKTCPFMNFVLQYKGTHPDQLSKTSGK